MSVYVDSCWICGRKFYRRSNKCIFHSLPIFSRQRFLLRVLLLSKLGAEWAKTSLGCSFTHLIYQLRVLLLSKLGAEWAKTSLVALLLIWYANLLLHNNLKSGSTFFASTVDKIFQKNFNFSWHHTSSCFINIHDYANYTTPTHTYSKLGYIIAQRLEIACVHRSINRSINSRLLENWFCLPFFASIVDKIFPKKFQFLMTSYLITIHDGHYYSWWLINIHDYANHAYSYIFIIMQIRPDPWPPQSDPWPPMNIHRFYRSITSYPLFKKSIKSVVTIQFNYSYNHHMCCNYLQQ